MTRRNRLERKHAKRAAWAAKATARAGQRFERARAIADNIPLGQPILQHHHSERHARRDQERIHGNMTKGVEETKRAEHHASKAHGLAQQLDRSIFSDDADAIPRLETKVVEEEATVARWKTINRAYRKAKGAEGWGDALELSRKVQATLAGNVGSYSWITAPFESYQFSNARTRIRQAKERLKSVRAQQARREGAEAAGGMAIVETPLDAGDTWAVITFADKPDRAIILALKEAGFRWATGSWCGYASKIPDSVRALLPAKEA